MNIPLKEKKTEAVRRMEMLDIFPETIRQFENENLISVSEPPFGAFYWADDEQKQSGEMNRPSDELNLITERRPIKLNFDLEKIGKYFLQNELYKITKCIDCFKNPIYNIVILKQKMHRICGSL